MSSQTFNTTHHRVFDFIVPRAGSYSNTPELLTQLLLHTSSSTTHSSPFFKSHGLGHSDIMPPHRCFIQPNECAQLHHRMSDQVMNQPCSLLPFDRWITLEEGWICGIQRFQRCKPIRFLYCSVFEVDQANMQLFINNHFVNLIHPNDAGCGNDKLRQFRPSFETGQSCGR